MKFNIKEKPRSTQTNRIIKRFLWFPTQIQQVNDVKEYRWLEWIEVEQNRYIGTSGWSDWKDRKYLINKKTEESTVKKRTEEEQRFHEYMEDNPR
jgi:hypothetical protein